MNATIDLRIVKHVVITFDEWVKQDLYTTKRKDYPTKDMFQAALTREWNRIVEQCGSLIELRGMDIEEHEIQEAFEDFACADADQDEEEIPTLSQDEDARLEALGMSRVHHNHVDYLWDENNNLLLDLQQNRVGTFDGITFTLDQQ